MVKSNCLRVAILFLALTFSACTMGITPAIQRAGDRMCRDHGGVAKLYAYISNVEAHCANGTVIEWRNNKALYPKRWNNEQNIITNEIQR